MKFHPKNYSKKNTPKKIQKIGDVLLLAGAIGGVIAAAPITLPASVIAFGGYMVVIGSVGKVITKFFSDGSDVSID